ncbi:hypothetical protein A7K91_10830 [Paenibacillus oryzae]|uniref:AB hydrolase-1 domain-containing protein n=1 Tax=Paenibacillus oryzae TaxID=1844972 RepID=A0A1A5YIU4_9BACL|nr:alpha/beta hydrolase [Paenibacillus oryzae]OBR65531.1 hypothetical protein A7K91_10830 [Paenibacillus oryzae]
MLVPHSMSGLHALYWAQQYPEEVSSIIGLDMAVPQSYESYRANMPLARLGAVAARLGITRWLPGASESDAIKYGTLSDEEKELYRTVFYRRTATKPMLAELQEVKASALKVAQGEMTQVPVLIFSSNGEGTGWKPEAWKEAQRSFAEEMPNREIVDVDSSHYIHDIQYDVIAETMKQYVEKTQASGMK